MNSETSPPNAASRLLCTVRGCQQPLVRGENGFRCANGHSFDVARSGYINLLQPQDRRSATPGDSVEAAMARRRLHDRGITAPLLNGIGNLARITAEDVVLDAGCGDGYYLGSMTEEHRCEGEGIDI